MSYGLSQSSTSKWINMMAKPLENAAACYIGSKFLGIDGRITNPIIGTQDAAMSLAVAGFGASLVTETVHSWVLPQITPGNQWYSTASMVLSPTIQTLGLYAYVSYFDSPEASSIGMTNFALLGAGGEIASCYVNDNFVTPWLSG
jgi:hypothetical protein